MNAWRFSARPLGQFSLVCCATAATCLATLSARQIPPSGHRPRHSQATARPGLHTENAQISFDASTHRVTIKTYLPEAARQGPLLRPDDFVVYEKMRRSAK